MAKKLFTSFGPIRGGCDHVHKTLFEVVECIEHDRSGCRGQGGYSDRQIRIINDKKEIQSYDMTVGPGRKLLLPQLIVTGLD